MVFFRAAMKRNKAEEINLPPVGDNAIIKSYEVLPNFHKGEGS
jgi:hypothetical protein